MITGSDNKRDVHRYIAGVLSGDIVACKTLKQACQRHLDDLDKDWEYDFDETIASNSIDFFPLLKHIDGEMFPASNVMFRKAYEPVPEGE